MPNMDTIYTTSALEWNTSSAKWYNIGQIEQDDLYFIKTGLW